MGNTVGKNFYADLNISALVDDLRKAEDCPRKIRGEIQTRDCVECQESDCERKEIIGQLQVAYSFVAEAYLRRNAHKMGISDPLDVSRLHDAFVDSVVISASKFNHEKGIPFEKWVWGLWNRKIKAFLRGIDPTTIYSLDTPIEENLTLKDLIENDNSVQTDELEQTNEVHPLDKERLMLSEMLGDLSSYEVNKLAAIIHSKSNAFDKRWGLKILAEKKQNIPVENISSSPSILVRRKLWKALSCVNV